MGAKQLAISMDEELVSRVKAAAERSRAGNVSAWLSDAAEAGSSDVVDAMVVIGASERDDTILTSEPEDLTRLLEALRPQRRPPLIRL